MSDYDRRGGPPQDEPLAFDRREAPAPRGPAPLTLILSILLLLALAAALFAFYRVGVHRKFLQAGASVRSALGHAHGLSGAHGAASDLERFQSGKLKEQDRESIEARIFHINAFQRHTGNARESGGEVEIFSGGEEEIPDKVQRGDGRRQGDAGEVREVEGLVRQGEVGAPAGWASVPVTHFCGEDKIEQIETGVGVFIKEICFVVVIHGAFP